MKFKFKAFIASALAALALSAQAEDKPLHNFATFKRALHKLG